MLKEIAKKFGTDKEEHGYTKVYESLFESFKDDEINLFEIGVLRGASLRTWNEYFQKGNIYGLDIFHRKEHQEIPDKLKKEGITAFKGSQADRDRLKEVMNEIGKPLDIIIDDGAHWNDFIQISLGCLFPYLKSGGYYIIEDLHTAMDRQNRKLKNNPKHTWSPDIRVLEKQWHGNKEFEFIHMLDDEQKHFFENVKEWRTKVNSKLMVIKKK